MSAAGITAAIRAVAEAIKGIFHFIGEALRIGAVMDQKRNEAQAIQREGEKKARNNAAIDAARTE